MRFDLRMWLFVIAAFLNHNALSKNDTLPNSHILKTFFTLTLKCATYAFILAFFLTLRFLSVYALVLPLFFCKPSLSSSCHCKFISSSLCSSPLLEDHHRFIACCLGFYCVVFTLSLLPPSLSSSLLPVLRHSSPPPLSSCTRLVVF